MLGGSIMGNIVVYQSNETERYVKLTKEQAIKKHAKLFNLEPALIKATIKTESTDYQFAFRVDYNSLIKQSWYSKNLTMKEASDKKYWASYGYMQVLYGVAKYNGFKGDADGLFDIETNIYHGCKVLSDYLKKYKGHVKRAIASYNAGAPRLRKNGDYRNQDYVDHVYGRYVKYGGTWRL